MRTLEYAFVVACLSLLVCLAMFPGRKKAAWTLSVLLVSSFLLCAYHENLRTVMGGAYLTGGALLAVTAFPLSGRITRIALLFSAAAALGTTAIAAAGNRPYPTGPYLIGQRLPDWRLLAPEASPKIAPAVELWYPVKNDVVGPSRWTRTLAAVEHFWETGKTGEPDEPLMNRAITPEGGPYPLLLYFSGGSGEAIDNVYLINELVSHGFIVASVHYPVVLLGVSSEDLELRKAEAAWLWDFSSEEATKATLARFDARVRQRAKDASSILSLISSFDASELDGLRGRIDTYRVGVFGYSFGGAVAAEAKMRDKRFMAAVNLDGWHFGDSLQHGVTSPYLYVISDEMRMPTHQELASLAPAERSEAILTKRQFDQPIAAMKGHGGYLLRISGAYHPNLADLAFRCFLLRRMALGPIDPSHAFRIISSYTLAFFQKYLQNRPSALLTGDDRLSEAHMEFRQEWAADEGPIPDNASPLPR